MNKRRAAAVCMALSLCLAACGQSTGNTAETAPSSGTEERADTSATEARTETTEAEEDKKTAPEEAAESPEEVAEAADTAETEEPAETDTTESETDEEGTDNTADASELSSDTASEETPAEFEVVDATAVTPDVTDWQQASIEELGLTLEIPAELEEGEFTLDQNIEGGGVLLNYPENPVEVEDVADWIVVPGFVAVVHDHMLLSYDEEGNQSGFGRPIIHTFFPDAPVRITGAAKPALLFRLEINKYSVGYLSEHPEIAAEDMDAFRWVVVMGEEGESDEIVLSLDSEKYSREDMIYLAGSVQIDPSVQIDWEETEDAGASQSD